MKGINHVALALAIPLAGAAAAGRPDLLPATLPAWAGLVVGSLAPDMDGEGSIARWGNWLPRYITPRPLVVLLNWIGETVSGVVRAIFGHRNALHWPVIGALLAMLGWRWGLDWLMWFGAGYCLHVLGDALTKNGVPLFGPVWGADISFSPMRTGGWVEGLLGLALWAVVGWQVVVMYVAGPVPAVVNKLIYLPK